MKGMKIFAMHNDQSLVSDMLAPNSDTMSLLEMLPDAVIFLDATGKIEYANASAANMVKARRDELPGHILWQVAPQVITLTLYQAVLSATRTRTPFQVKYRSPGTQTWLRVYLSPISYGIMLFFHKETEPTLLEDSPLQRKGEYLDLLESISERVAILTPEGLLLDINQPPLTDAQVQREEVVGKPFTQFPAWSSMPVAQAQLRTAIAHAKQGNTVRFEATLQPQASWYRDLAVTLTPYRDVNQQVEYLICAGQDITARKRAEEKLCDLIEAIPQFVWTAEPDGYPTYTNQRLTDYLGMTLQQLEGDGWVAYVHPNDRQRVQNAWRTSIHTGMPYEIEHRIQNGTNGIYRWFLVRGMPQRDAQGTIISWIGTCTDIDEQKRTMEALRQSQERVQALMASNIIGIFVAEEEEILEANDTFLHMTGYSQEDLHHRQLNWFRMTTPEYRSITEQAHQQLKLHEYLPAYEKEYLCKDGSRLPVLVGGVMTQLDPLQTICFVLDNSARKALEQRKDDFLSIASHELRTPLTSLRLQTQMLRKQLAKQDIHRADVSLSRMERQLDTVTRLVEELFDLSKIQAGKLEYTQETVNLNELLQEIVEVTQQTQTTHTITISGPTEPVLMIGDRDRLWQIFLNLINNAIKYSPDANQVEVNMTTSKEELMISVHDHGIGIPQEQRDKIFERFYRAVSKHQRVFPGLGMGLSIASEIVKHYGGTITLESEIGTGSTFGVTLPRTSI